MALHRTTALALLAGALALALVSGAAASPLEADRDLPPGAPRFRAAEAVDLGFAPADVDVGDLDGDGRADLVAADARGSRLAVLPVPGGGSDSPPSAWIPLEAAPGRILLLDADLDGDLDIVVAFRPGGGAVLENDGGGRLAPSAWLPLPGDPAEILAGDIDLDGVPDLLATHRGPGAVCVLPGVASRGGPAGSPIDAVLRPGPWPSAAAIIDIDGDGLPEVAVGTSGMAAPPLASQVAFFARAPGPGWSLARTVAAGGQDPAGGPGLAGERPLRGAHGIARLVPGDWDGDGKPDLAAVLAGSPAWSGAIAIVGPEGPLGEIPGAGPNPADASAADIDGDGTEDLVVADADAARATSTVSVILRHDTIAYSTPSRAERLVLRDLDGDGGIDLAVASPVSTEISLVRGGPGGRLRAARRLVPEEAVSAVACADLDGDGRAEVIAGVDRLFGADLLAIFTSAISTTALPGARTIVPEPGMDILPIEIRGVASPVAIAVADMDGDGAPDLAVAHGTVAGITVLGNAGGLSFQRRSRLALPTRSASVIAADLDGDGRPDVAAATRERSKGRIDVFLGPGAAGGSPGAPALLGPDSSAILPWEILELAAADLDGDGRPDILALQRAPIPPPGEEGGPHPLPLRLVVARNDGSGGFGPIAEVFAGPGAFALAAADVDGDGDVDVVTVDPAESALRIARNDGQASFADGGSVPLAGPAEDVLAVDLDRDGALDVAALVRRPGAVAVLLARDGGLVPAGTWRVGEEASALAVGDADGDGILDCAVAHIATGGVSVLLGEPPAGPVPAGRSFRRGDADGDGVTSLFDAVAVLERYFPGRIDAVRCESAADADDDGRIAVSDALRILAYLFLGEEPPPPPFPGCGLDPTPDGLSCEAACR